MKTISAELQAHLDSGLTTLATCWRLALANGTVQGYTDHDADLTIDGIVYQKTSGYTASKVVNKSELSVDNLELQGLLTDIKRADIEAGLYDYAEVRLFLVNWADLSQGEIKLRKGTLGRVTTQGGEFQAELRGLAQALQQTVGASYSVTCRADFGDAKCKFDLSTITVTGAVTAASDQRSFTDAARAEADNYFNGGLLTWTGGANAGYAMEVKSFTAGGQFVLAQPMPYAIAAGDTFSVYPGCAKRWDLDCRDRYNNLVNFRGEPYVPGPDKINRFGGQNGGGDHQ